MSDAPLSPEALYELALEATGRAHPPYSGLHVGAVLVADDGTLVPGANVEFGSYGLTICAERTALARGVTDGHRHFTRVGVARSDGLPISPCGMCRQSLADFGIDMSVVYRGPDGIIERPLRELLVDAFLPEDLPSA
jgi:cytidine deaminase